MSSLAKKIIKQKNIILGTVQGKKDGKDFYAFLATNELNFDKITKNLGDEMILGDKSVVIYSDFGSEIPEGIYNAVVDGFKAKYELAE